MNKNLNLNELCETRPFMSLKGLAAQKSELLLFNVRIIVSRKSFFVSSQRTSANILMANIFVDIFGERMHDAHNSIIFSLHI